MNNLHHNTVCKIKPERKIANQTVLMFLLMRNVQLTVEEWNYKTSFDLGFAYGEIELIKHSMKRQIYTISVQNNTSLKYLKFMLNPNL